MEQHILPDVLRPSLRVVFCGTAAGKFSAEMEAYYAHPNNKFWSVLSETRLTPRRLKPIEFRQVIDFGLGLTDLCKTASGNDDQVTTVTPIQRAELREKVSRYQPAFLAFTSLEAGKRYYGHRVALGFQNESIGATQLYVLPSTSLMAAWNWESTKYHWQALANKVQAPGC